MDVRTSETVHARQHFVNFYLTPTESEQALYDRLVTETTTRDTSKTMNALVHVAFDCDEAATTVAQLDGSIKLQVTSLLCHAHLSTSG